MTVDGPARRRWAYAAGHVPLGTTGHEPEMTSRDELCLLNTSDEDACAQVTVYHADRAPVGPYEIAVPARRVRHVRVNDLIDPEAVPLGVPYGLAVESDVPVVLQVRHLDTAQPELGLAVSVAVPGPA